MVKQATGWRVWLRFWELGMAVVMAIAVEIAYLMWVV